MARPASTLNQYVQALVAGEAGFGETTRTGIIGIGHDN